MYPSMLCHCGALHPVTCHNGSMERWKEPCDISGHSRSGLTLLAAFSDTAHMERAMTWGSLGNKSQHNRLEQKSCSFFTATKGLNMLMTYLNFLRMLYNVFILKPFFIFHFSDAEYCSFISVFRNITTDSWRHTDQNEANKERAKTPICCGAYLPLLSSST